MSLQLEEPIPEEFLDPVVLEDRPCSTTTQLDAQVIGWGRNEVGNLCQRTCRAILKTTATL